MQRGSAITVVASLLSVGLAPSVCRAETTADNPPAAPDIPRPIASNGTRRWYGWQIYTADAVAGTLYLSAVADDHSTTLFAFSGVAFVLGGPAIHAAHGRWDIALGSLGLRVLGPAVGAVIGAQADTPRAVEDGSSSDNSSSKWAITGVAIGGLVASAIDGLLLSYDNQVPPPPPRNQLLRLESLPQLLLLQHGIGLGYSGQF